MEKGIVPEPSRAEQGKPPACDHCRNGFLANRFGEDVECVNGVLIDIDEAHEGWDPQLNYPVAPCHPGWTAQCAGRDFDNDCQDRLEAWAGLAARPPQEPAEPSTGRLDPYNPGAPDA